MTELRCCDRREFLTQVARCGAAAAGLGVTGDIPSLLGSDTPQAPDHTLTVIAGKPRDRGRSYGQQFEVPIRSFLEKEIYERFTTPSISRDDLLRYAGQCSD